MIISPTYKRMSSPHQNVAVHIGPIERLLHPLSQSGASPMMRSSSMSFCCFFNSIFLTTWWLCVWCLKNNWWNKCGSNELNCNLQNHLREVWALKHGSRQGGPSTSGSTRSRPVRYTRYRGKLVGGDDEVMMIRSWWWWWWGHDYFHVFSFAKGGEGENGRLDISLVLPLPSPPPLLSCSLPDTGE